MTKLALNHYICPPGYGTQKFLDDATALGVGAVGLTRAVLDEIPVPRLREMLNRTGLSVSSLNSAGYFTFTDAAKQAEQRDVNARLIETAAELEVPTLCVITGGVADCACLEDARGRIVDGLFHLDELAAQAGVNLGLEPIHPVGMLSKGCVNSIAQARQVIAPLTATGLILDLYHSWWDDGFNRVLDEDLRRVHLIQICNVILHEDEMPRRSTRLDQGVVDVAGLIAAARTAGYEGRFEFEIFARDHDGSDTRSILADAASIFDRWIGR